MMLTLSILMTTAIAGPGGDEPVGETLFCHLITQEIPRLLQAQNEAFDTMQECLQHADEPLSEECWEEMEDYREAREDFEEAVDAYRDQCLN